MIARAQLCLMLYFGTGLDIVAIEEPGNIQYIENRSILSDTAAPLNIYAFSIAIKNINADGPRVQLLVFSHNKLNLVYGPNRPEAGENNIAFIEGDRLEIKRIGEGQFFIGCMINYGLLQQIISMDDLVNVLKHEKGAMLSRATIRAGSGVTIRLTEKKFSLEVANDNEAVGGTIEYVDGMDGNKVIQELRKFLINP